MRTLLILLVVFLASCSSPSSEADPDPVFLRVQNASEFDFSNVVISFTGDEVNMGTVEAGQYSAYQPFDTAYHYGYIEAESGDETYRLVPIDYFGEKPLESGYYTFELDIENGDLQFEFREDDPESVDQ